MLIGIDGNEANLVQRVGAGQYAFHLLIELAKQPAKNVYHIYLKNKPLSDLPPESANWHYHIFGPSKLWTRFALPLHLFLGNIKLDLFFSPSHYSPILSPFPTVPTIHDLGYLDRPQDFNAKDIHQLINWTKQSLHQAKHIIAVSEFTKNELVRIYHLDPQKISIVCNGVAEPPPINDSLAVLSKFIISQPYFIDVGTLKPNKNLPFLISAFAKYHQKNPKNQLVIAGKKGWLYDDIFSTVKKEKIESAVIFTDYISESEKWALLKNAQALVIPSTYEGFGIPAIESQKVCTPVIASDIPAFQEVLGNTAILIDPHSQNSLLVAFGQILQPKVRQKLIASGLQRSSGYSWTNSAKSLIQAFNTI